MGLETKVMTQRKLTNNSYITTHWLFEDERQHNKLLKSVTSSLTQFVQHHRDTTNYPNHCSSLWERAGKGTPRLPNATLQWGPTRALREMARVWQLNILKCSAELQHKATTGWICLILIPVSFQPFYLPASNILLFSHVMPYAAFVFPLWFLPFSLCLPICFSLCQSHWGVNSH